MTIQPTHWVRQGPRTIDITRSADLEHTPDVACELGRAADGLPLALLVHREVDVRRPVLSALRSPERLGRDLEKALAALEKATHAHTIARGVVAVGKHLYYETAADVPALFGQTLLARTLGAVSPMILPEDVARAGAAAPSRFETSALLNLNDLREVAQDEPAPAAPPPATTGQDARLWVQIGGDARLLAVPRQRGNEDPAARLAAARPIVLESLLAVRSARWHVTHARHEAPGDGPLAETTAYRAALRDATRVGWSISRVDALKLIAELARAVDRDWHARGRVHGDLKPGNVLLERDRISAFDAIDVPEGETCAGVTEGWAAPEQILVRPVAAPTDVFALGLMLASTLSAAIFGEERSVVVPAAGQGRRRLKLFVDPDVWVDPAQVALPTAGRVAWRGLVVQCLAADPARRPRRGVDLAARIDDLLRRGDVPGRIPIACGPGQLELTVGGGEPMWVLRDAQ